jgi:simple sugar transport system permease protein
VSALDVELPARRPGAVERLVEQVVGATGAVVPVAAVLAALVAGSVLILLEGESPLAVYWAVVEGVLTEPRGLTDTATAATPLILVATGYAVAYRARVFTIGGEGQYLVGAVGAMAVVTSPGLRDLPSLVLAPTGLLTALAVGGAWGMLSGWLRVRFGASVVISSLMLSYIGEAVLQWAVRDGIRDPDSFIPASRVAGNAGLPPVGHTHLGFLVALALPVVVAAFIARHRGGFRVTALGHNGEALDANEVPAGRIVLWVTLMAGALAGLAGFVEVAGVTGRLNGDSSVGFGWEAIIVALLGRLHPIAVLAAGLGLAAMTIGFESSQRTHDLPSSLIGVITALIVVFVVIGDAVGQRLKAAS